MLGVVMRRRGFAPRAMLAKFDGACANCNGVIRANRDSIFYSRRGDAEAYVTHEDCNASRVARETEARDASLDARYVRAEGPVPYDLDRSDVARWHHTTATTTQTYSGPTVCVVRDVTPREGNACGALYMGLATFLGWNWYPCVEVPS